MQSQRLIESEVDFTHLTIFRLSDINIHRRQVDGICLYSSILIHLQAPNGHVIRT